MYKPGRGRSGIDQSRHAIRFQEMANNPGLAQSPEGRAMTADILRQMAMQDQLIGRQAMKLKDPSDFYDLQDRVYQENPIVVHVGGKAIMAADPLPGYAANQPAGAPPPASPLAAPAEQTRVDENSTADAT
jgi:hypothetical protein